ncbi:dTDP-4-dehydrorhamnose reductase [Lysobacter sp. HA18]
MTTLVIGANGQVGQALLSHAPRDGSWVASSRNGDTVGDVRTHALDVTDAVAVASLICELRPEVVINASAFTAVDRAETERDAAFAVNAQAPLVMAHACHEVGAFLVHYSTDYVFDGSGSEPYREIDVVAPLGVYGQSKLAGERSILGNAASSLVIRTAWVYSPHGHNFLRTMLRLAAERPELRVVNDQVGAPTTADFIARTTLELLARDRRPTGLLNVVCAGTTSWHGFASAIVDGAFERGMLARRPAVIGISTSEFPTPAKRPAYSVLSTGKLRATGIATPDWRDELARTLDAMTGRSGANP